MEITDIIMWAFKKPEWVNFVNNVDNPYFAVVYVAALGGAQRQIPKYSDEEIMKFIKGEGHYDHDNYRFMIVRGVNKFFLPEEMIQQHIDMVLRGDNFISMESILKEGWLID